MSMRYRLTCLTPLLVGDGRKLSPIDYMVWKDQVNVLDQWRIFRLLAKGPRLDGYLSQLKRADKLDFASWGGFAQNFAGRRIPFESPAYSGYWNRASGESLHIPTFSSGAAVAGSAISLKCSAIFSGVRSSSRRNTPGVSSIWVTAKTPPPLLTSKVVGRRLHPHLLRQYRVLRTCPSIGGR